MNLNYRTIGIRIKEVRGKRGITQEHLAAITGLSKTHICNIENGFKRMSLQALIRIADALNCSADDILCDIIKINRHVHENEISQTISDCDDEEIRAISDIVKTVKNSFRSIKSSSVREVNYYDK